MNKNLQTVTALCVSALFSCHADQAGMTQALRQAVRTALPGAADIRARAALVALGEHLGVTTGDAPDHRFCTRQLLQDWTPSPSWEGPSPDGEYFDEYRGRMVREILLECGQVKAWAIQTLPTLMERAAAS